MRDQKGKDGTRVDFLKQAGVPVPKRAEDTLNKEKAKTNALALIDDFMRKVGIDNPKGSIDAEGRRHFTAGSADGRAGIVEIDGELFLRVEALIMGLPSDKELILPLMRNLLEINIGLPGVARLGLANDSVLTCVMLNLRELSQPMFYNAIHSTMMLADSLDEELKAKYSGTILKRKS